MSFGTTQNPNSIFIKQNLNGFNLENTLDQSKPKGNLFISDFNQIEPEIEMKNEPPTFRRSNRYKAVKKLKDYATNHRKLLRQNGRITLCQKYK
mmetsp:Transcript_10287/g.9089  ORF Transcript_10287/g.9089 Transcript_10287/m.9089 type:complete len:94 (+) Transcript_10287:406-687(+)